MLELYELFSQTPALLLTFAGLLGLTIGSFLNVVIYRLPIMLQRRWEAECADFIANTDNLPTDQDAEPEPPFNLLIPPSTCPACGHRITAAENIPVLSYLFQRGKCKGCQSPISIQYPLVELLTGALSVLVIWHYGLSWQGVAGLLFTWTLVALTIIDTKTQLLPDILTLPLMWLGLLLNLQGVFTSYESSLYGAVFGYLSLWTVFQGFKLFTGKEGMGHGDFKLLAALGAWGGWQILPIVVILSSVVGAIVGVLMITVGKQEQGAPMPFGPYLAAAGWIALIWGDSIAHTYMQYAGLAP